MISALIKQTRQMQNFAQVFSLLGEPAKRDKCEGTTGLVTQAQKLMQEASQATAARDVAIVAASGQVRRAEITTWSVLIMGARVTGNTQIVGLLQHSLSQEEQIADSARAPWHSRQCRERVGIVMWGNRNPRWGCRPRRSGDT